MHLYSFEFFSSSMCSFSKESWVWINIVILVMNILKANQFCFLCVNLVIYVSNLQSFHGGSNETWMILNLEKATQTELRYNWHQVNPWMGFKFVKFRVIKQGVVFVRARLKIINEYQATITFWRKNSLLLNRFDFFGPFCKSSGSRYRFRSGRNNIDIAHLGKFAKQFWRRRFEIQVCDNLNIATSTLWGILLWCCLKNRSWKWLSCSIVLKFSFLLWF